MTFEEALRIIKLEEYHIVNEEKCKRKIVPKTGKYLFEYTSHMYSNNIQISNEQAKVFSKDNNFAIISYPLWALPGELFKL